MCITCATGWLADLYDALIAANRIEHKEKRMLKMKKILHDLPPHHFDTFHYLANHLYQVQLHQDKNKVCVYLCTLLCLSPRSLQLYIVHVFVLQNKVAASVHYFREQ